MNLKSERGSVTIYVLSVTICITLILLSIFVRMMNKNSSQYKQIEQIYNEYAGESNNEKIDNVYEDTINATKGQVQISAYFYKQSGEKYDLSEYTNESLTLKVSCSGGSNGEKAKITIGNKVVEYTSQGITIDENCVIKIVYSGKQKTITVNGIDKTAPTVAMSPNGGTGYVMPTTGKATIKTTLTASDVGESGIKTKQYAWSTSNATEPTEGWTDFENGKEISKTDCTQGDYYLWTKVLDGAGNRAEKVKVSNVFTVTGQTIDESKITIALSTEDWTNKDVTAVITYGKNLTQNRKAGFGTANIANAMTVTATENGTIYAEATDRAGNKVVVTKQVTKIDKKAPTIPTITAKLDSDAGNAYDGTWTNKNVTITLKSTDANSGIAKYQLKYSGTNGVWKDVSNPDPWSAERNETVYYRAVDNAGNVSAESSTVIKIDKTAPVKPTYVSRYQDKTAYTSGTWTNKTVYTDITTEDKASGVAKIQYSFDNSTWGDLSLLASSGIQASGTKATGTEEWTLKDRNNNVWFRAVDNVGNVSEASDVFNVKYDLTAPTASRTEVKNLTTTGYDVYIYNVAAAGSGVNRVQFPTWTESNGQDDIISDWVTNSKSTGTKQSDGTTWVYHVNITDHKNEYGKYNTHIYAYDNLGNSNCIGGVSPTVPGVTVTYNYSENGGTSATKTSATVGYNSAVDLTPRATKNGYTFVGWNTNKDATTALSSLKVSASEATLYAIFKKDITATYKYWNGSETTSTTKSATIYNKTTSATITAPTLANSSKDGITYIARGWSTSNTGNATIAVTSGGSQTISANTTYYGAYQATITATFYYHKGTDQYATTQTSATASGTRYMNSSGAYINSNITIPTEVTKSTGYYGTQYKGVASAVSSSTAVTPNTGTTKYYAFYNVGITYYYYNGSAQTTATSTRRAISNGTTYVATVDSEPSKPNYYGATFSHWSYDATKYSADYKRTPAATAVLELYAVYSKTVTATFNYYNGSAAAITTASGTKYYISKSGGVNTYNNNISVPSAVSSSKGPSGIAYSHISTTRTGSATTPNTSTGIYYAVYKKTVTATKKEYNNKTSSLTGTAYGYYDGKATNARINLGTSTASGYIFRGWSTSTTADATTVNATVSLVNNTTYYASYSSTPTISLTYNANSGSGAPGSQTGKITRYMNYVGTTKDSGSVTLTVSATKPTRSGYTFVSWNTKSDGTGTSYAPGDTLKTSANVTLYAIWKKEVTVGDIISLTSTKGTTERFYVLSYDESTQKAKALAEWNLKVGANYNISGSKIADIPTTESGYGLQDSTMKGWLSGQKRKGTVAFSNSWYFKDTFASYPVDKNGKSYVYDSNSNLYTYVNKYKELLGNTDKVSEVSLASYEDITALWSNKSNYKWLYSTSFWFGSAYGASRGTVWTVDTDGDFYDYYYSTSVMCGVRPVITIDMSKI